MASNHVQAVPHGIVFPAVVEVGLLVNFTANGAELPAANGNAVNGVVSVAAEAIGLVGTTLLATGVPVRVMLGATLAAGVNFAAGSNGRARAVSAGNFIAGKLLEGGVNGDIVTAILYPPSAKQ